MRIEACTALLKSDRLTAPNRALALIHRGDARASNREYALAVADYSEAIKLDPENDSGFIQRAIARRATGDLDGAIADDSEAIRIKPDRAVGYANRGVAYRLK